MKKTRFKYIALAALICDCLNPVVAQTTLAPVPPVSTTRVQQLQDLHWGMFICWSFSTFSGKEWTPGITNIDLFAAKDCDTDQWAKTAKDAGMGYILFLTKHHDGFCLWDTQTTDRKVTKAPLGRDVLAELRKSCDKYGIKLALYHSEGEWAWPDKPGGGRYSNNGGYNPEMKKAQLKELLTRYGPIEYIWFDHAVGDGGLSHADTVRWVKQFQPNCFVGFNHGDAAGDIRIGELGRPGPVSAKTGIGADSGTAKSTDYRVAEFTYPILPKHAGGAMWFYSLPKHDQLCLPAERLYSDYLGAVKFGDIFSIDVGPDYHGRLRAIDVETLHQVGDLIRAHAPTPVLPVADSPKQAASLPPAGYELEWSDEFNGDHLDTSKWDFRTDSRMWSTQKPENVSVRDGHLILTGKKEAASGKRYTGAGIISKPGFKYGYYEARFKVPPGAGWHTSFWMMKHNGQGGAGTTASVQELDACENDSVTLTNYSVNVHKWNPPPAISQGQHAVKTPDLSAEFHTFGCEFTPDAVRYYFEGKLVQTVAVTNFAHGDQQIWLTTIASNLGNTLAVDDSQLPAVAEFDYVRFYTKK